MGTFGVLRPDDKPCSIEVKDCHINVWSLDGLFGRRVVILDVGLRLRATTADQQSLTVLVPGETAPECPTDLVPLLRDGETLTLIFNQPVPIANDVMTVGNDEIELLPITSRDTKSEVLTAGFSQWNIHFAKAVPTGRDSYARLRFRLRRTERLWEWRRAGLVRVRAVVDFRVGDLRGVASVPDAEALVLRALPLTGLNLFVIAPIWLRMRTVSPPLKYMRLFEGTMWERYLGRATKLGTRDKLVIYQWEASNVDALHPYRAFLDLGREPDVIALRNHVTSAVVLTLCLLATVAAWMNIDPVADWIRRHAPEVWKTLVGAMSIGVLGKIAGWSKRVREGWHRATDLFERLESWLFHVLRADRGR